MKGYWNRIGVKWGALIAALFLLVLLVLGVVTDRIVSSFYHTKKQGDVEELAKHLAGMAHSHHSGTEEMLQSFAEFSNLRIYLVHVSTLQLINPSARSIQDATFLRKVDQTLLLAGTPVFFKFDEQGGERYFTAAHPVEDNELAVYVLSSLRDMDESLAQLRALLLWTGVGAFLLALGVTYGLTKFLSRPLIQMEQAARRIARGELETRVPVQSSDELGTLSSAINDLARDLQHYRDTRSQFFANVSHELRTPVTYLEGYSKVLKDGWYESEEERQQYLEIIQQESKRLKTMIHELFELAKMEEGRLELQLEEVDLSELVASCVEKVRLKTKEKGLALEISVSPSLPPLLLDGLRTEQLVLNLLENAVRYTQEGTISVKLEQVAQEALLTIEDTGIGIPESELHYIFDRFYRVENSGSREFGGTGLGLSLVRHWAQLQGGQVQVYSTLGQGTKFEVRLPLST